jgi:hypothetical protein
MDDYIASIAADYRKEIQRIEPRLMFFGALLLISHVLKITPSEIEAGGVKIAIDDVSVIHGGIALVFLYYFYTTIAMAFQGTVLLPLANTQRMLRNMVRSARKPYKDDKTKKMKRRTPKKVKRNVWWSIFWFQLFTVPFVLVMGLIIVGALIFSVIDLWSFGNHMVARIFEIMDSYDSAAQVTAQ